MPIKTASVEVEVEVDLKDFSDDDLIDEVSWRGIEFESEELEDIKTFLNTIWEKKRAGVDYNRDLDDLIYCVIGKIS